MITVEEEVKNKYVSTDGKLFKFKGLSSDEKPVGQYGGAAIENGSTFLEMNTEKLYHYDKENRAWVTGVGVIIDTEIDENSTNDEVAGAKAVYDSLPVNFTGTDGTTAGTNGLVPAPTTSDADKYLKSDGTWATVSGGSSYTAGANIDITNDVISVTGILPGEDRTALTMTQDQYYSVSQQFETATPSSQAGACYFIYTNSEDQSIEKAFYFKGNNETGSGATVFKINNQSEEVTEILYPQNQNYWTNPQNVTVTLEHEESVIFNFYDATPNTPEVYLVEKTGALVNYLKKNSTTEQSMVGDVSIEGGVKIIGNGKNLTVKNSVTAHKVVGDSISQSICHVNALDNSVAFGQNTTAGGYYSFTIGSNTKAARKYQFVEGKYNIEESGSQSTEGTYAHIVGNGTSNSARSNAYTLDTQGNGWFSGNVYVGSTSGTNRDEGSKKLATEDFVTQAIADALANLNN